MSIWGGTIGCTCHVNMGWYHGVYMSCQYGVVPCFLGVEGGGGGGGDILTLKYADHDSRISFFSFSAAFLEIKLMV